MHYCFMPHFVNWILSECYVLHCSWNRLDIGIVILSIIGIILEEIKSGLIPINPTIIRAMRVLRIARGRLSLISCLSINKVIKSQLFFTNLPHNQLWVKKLNQNYLSDNCVTREAILLPPPRRLCFRRCLSVCLTVSNFAQKLPNGFA